MTHLEIREKFLNFFKKRGHKIIPSSSLIPDDPSVLLTTAGMQQFKPYFTEEKNPTKDFGSRNTVSIQKCFRTSDIESVGDESHLTFFEMLGNFSFGGYFKKEAIQYAYDFITKELNLEIDYVSVFQGDQKIPADEESRRIWLEFGMPAQKIKQAGKKDNFWGPTGNEGPCGPTTEIYIKGVEIWNIVFNEYRCRPDGSFEKLKTPGVDTGMGLERLAMILQNKNNVFETDLFASLAAKIKSQIPNLKIANQNLKTEAGGNKSIRIMADHMRASIFLISEGITPGNLGKEYILRRLVRKAARRAKQLEIGELPIEKLVCDVVSVYKEIYPELKEKQKEIAEVLIKEKRQYEITINKGFKKFEKLAKQEKKITGKKAFRLYETYGFPLEFIRELAKEKNVPFDESGFKEAFRTHQEISRAGAEKKFGGLRKEAGDKEIKLHTATHLLHQALRDVLGEHVKQMGSDINEDRLRFDFSHGQKMTSEEIKKVEGLVNQKIKEKLPVKTQEMPYEKAIKSGALAFFKEKYPKQVRVYSIGDFSREICGGPHVENTGELGKFRIIKEESSSAGVRRVKAILDE
jgi:alanyl-tRNA synthetase